MKKSVFRTHASLVTLAVAAFAVQPAVAQDVPAPEPEPAQSASVGRPTADDYRSRTPEACARITAYEEQTCRDTATRIGDEAGRACQDSALARSVACSLGQEGALPPLVRRGN